ncbi:MAG: M50 family metallopeptidase [Promethearchaeota archaeon]
MPICYHCGNDVETVYKCESCGHSYCAYHLDPIEHNCDFIKDSANNPIYQSGALFQDQNVVPSNDNFNNSNVIRGTTDGTYTWYRQEKNIPENAFDPNSGITFKGILLPHKSELIHFIIGGALIFIIGLISFYNSNLISMGFGWTIFLLASFYLTAFLFHELGHRQVAIHFGFQSKFRLLTFGMIITIIGLLSSMMSLFSSGLALPSLALPGAVVIIGLDKVSKQTGLCKAVGPFINLIYGIILLLISYLLPKTTFPLNFFISYGAYFNFMLGAFNMIPVGILDGQNIWKWNKKVYLILMISLLALLVINLMSINAPVDSNPYLPP